METSLFSGQWLRTEFDKGLEVMEGEKSEEG
jgi:hypothetical protein